jgi:hypothetical protein
MPGPYNRRRVFCLHMPGRPRVPPIVCIALIEVSDKVAAGVPTQKLVGPQQQFLDTDLLVLAI